MAIATPEEASYLRDRCAKEHPKSKEGKGRPNKNCIPFFLTYRTFDGGEEWTACGYMFINQHEHPADIVRVQRIVIFEDFRRKGIASRALHMLGAYVASCTSNVRMLKEDLQPALGALGLDTGGNRTELQERLKGAQGGGAAEGGEAVSADACLFTDKQMRLMINTSEEGMVSALERMVVDGIFERSRDGKLSKEGNKSFTYVGVVDSYDCNFRMNIFYPEMMKDFEKGAFTFKRFETEIAKCPFCEERKTFVGNGGRRVRMECICEACHGGGGGAAAGGALKRKVACIDLTQTRLNHAP